MDFIKEDLQTRADEISEFINLIKFIENKEKIIGEDSDNQPYDISLSLKNTIKGNVFLLLYNLIESTMRESIKHIHDELDSREIPFNQLKKEFRREVLKRAKSEKIGLDNLCRDTALDISKQILKATLKEDAIFSGNIDHPEICNQAKIYGFETSTDYIKTKHGGGLKLIKDKRNDLAHGNSSFSEIGKLYTIEQMDEFAQDVINYLDAITTHIANFLIQQDYLEKEDA